MQKYTALGILGVISCLSLLSGCRQGRQQNEVVKETYIHKYGVPVAKTDWDEQGKDGKIVQLRNDGVTVSQTYAKGVLNGESTYTFPNSSTVQRVEIFREGELIATRDNHANGMPMQEHIFEESVLAKFTRWYADGTPAATETYQGAYLTRGEYRNTLNTIEAQVQTGNGIRICRSEEGDLFSKDAIQDGSMVERVTYFSNGDPSSVTPFEKGEIHGMRLTYLQGGLPNTAELWMYGKQSGTTIVYSNGEKYAEVPYLNGKKHGIEKRFRDGSLLVEELTWTQDVQHGERKLYVDGDTKSEWYHQGEVVSRTTFERMNKPF